MTEPRRLQSVAKVVRLPRTRRLSWAWVLLEYAHQLVLALWIGGLGAAGLLAGPTIFAAVVEPLEAANASLDLTLKVSFIGAGAGGFLLLTTLLMHLMELRGLRATLLQTAFLLGMTLAAVVVYVGVAPPLRDLLQQNPELLLSQRPADLFARYVALHHAMDLLVLAQIAAGALLLLLGVRRWYRYVAPGATHRAIDA